MCKTSLQIPCTNFDLKKIDEGTGIWSNLYQALLFVVSVAA